jgi:hypothetical protein
VLSHGRARGVPQIARCGYLATLGIDVLNESPIKTLRKDGLDRNGGEYPFLPAFADGAGITLSRANGCTHALPNSTNI